MKTFIVLFFGSLLLVVVCSAAIAQSSAPVPMTADQDRQNMMDQLGIKALRPGGSANEKAPDHVNYDESKANPFPDVPDALTMKNGKKVTSAEMWWKERRPGDRGGLRARSVWTCAEKCREGDLDGRCNRPRICGLHARDREEAGWPCGQFSISGD